MHVKLRHSKEKSLKFSEYLAQKVKTPSIPKQRTLESLKHISEKWINLNTFKKVTDYSWFQQK